MPQALDLTFEAGTPGQVATGATGFASAGFATTFDTTRAHSGTKSAKFAWRLSNIGGSDEHFASVRGSWNVGATLGQGDELWARLYYFHPSGFTFGNSIRKEIRFTTSGNLRISILTQNHGRGGNELTESNETTSPITQFALGSFVRTNAWDAIELYVRFHATPSQARYSIWHNGVRIWHYDGARRYVGANDITGTPTSIRTLPSSGATCSSGLVHGTWNGGTPADQDEWVDDFVVWYSLASNPDPPPGRDAFGNPFIGLSEGGTQGVASVGALAAGAVLGSPAVIPTAPPPTGFVRRRSGLYVPRGI